MLKYNEAICKKVGMISGDYLTVGKTYKILDMFEAMIKIIDDKGEQRWLDISHFDLK